MRTTPSWTLCLLCLLLVFLAAHATASLVPRQVQVNPPGGSLIEGALVNVSTNVEIIPSGAMTFSETHTLSLSTDLKDARWQIVVIVDGMQAAVIPKDGNHVFINGFLLSYPTTRDVSVNILLEGRVPPSQERHLVVLRFAELNTQGDVVSESEHRVTRTIPDTGTPPSPAPTEVQSPRVPTSERVTLSCIPALGALLAVFSWIRIPGKE